MRRLVGLTVMLIALSCSNSALSTPATTPTLTPAAGAASLEGVLPASNSVPGWTANEAVQVYNRESIFRLVDGQADLFFSYGFRQVAAQRYSSSDGGSVDVQVWQLARPADAYGLFTSVASAAPTDVGNDGDLEAGRRISFWQDCYTIHVYARQPLHDAVLLRFARAISQALPKGGERPALVTRLPKSGLKDHGYIFFHEELAIQDRIFLGGKNILSLSHDTDGLVARYDRAGQNLQLLLIKYPTAEGAAAGLQALRLSAVKDLLSSKMSGTLLGGVFGKTDEAQADQLLADALGR